MPKGAGATFLNNLDHGLVVLQHDQLDLWWAGPNRSRNISMQEIVLVGNGLPSRRGGG